MTGSARAAGVEEERFNMISSSSSQRNLIQGEWGYYDDDDYVTIAILVPFGLYLLGFYFYFFNSTWT